MVMDDHKRKRPLKRDTYKELADVMRGLGLSSAKSSSGEKDVREALWAMVRALCLIALAVNEAHFDSDYFDRACALLKLSEQKGAP